jgi:DNA polymerase elongation subunit (family B)
VKVEPKIVLLDIETLADLKAVMSVLPSLSDYPGLTLKASINSVICFGYKVFGEDDVHVVNAWDDVKRWSKDVNDDKFVLEEIHNILADADAIVSHNGKRFDWKFIQTRMLKHGLDPLPKIIHIDTCVLAKQHLYLSNNRLNTLAKFMTSEEKMENGGWELWCKVLNRDKKAMKLMSEYCAQDIVTLEAVFKKLRPFINNLPNYNQFRTSEKICCPNCGSTRMIGNGYRVMKEKMVKRIRCSDCGTSSSITREGKDPKTS